MLEIHVEVEPAILDENLVQLQASEPKKVDLQIEPVTPTDQHQESEKDHQD